MEDFIVFLGMYPGTHGTNYSTSTTGTTGRDMNLYDYGYDCTFV